MLKNKAFKITCFLFCLFKFEGTTSSVGTKMKGEDAEENV